MDSLAVAGHELGDLQPLRYDSEIFSVEVKSNIMNNQTQKIQAKSQNIKAISHLQPLLLEQLNELYAGSDPEYKYVPVRR